MVAYVQGAVMTRYYEMHAHDFQRYGPFWGVGSTAVWNLCENSSDLVAWPVPQTCMTTRAFFKVCLVLIFLTTIVEKHVPRILKKFPLRSILMSILCQFHAQRPLWIWNYSPLPFLKKRKQQNNKRLAVRGIPKGYRAIQSIHPAATAWCNEAK